MKIGEDIQFDEQGRLVHIKWDPNVGLKSPTICERSKSLEAASCWTLSAKNLVNHSTATRCGWKKCGRNAGASGSMTRLSRTLFRSN